MYIRYNDISGQKFGRLTALYKLHNTKGRTKWLCVCDEWCEILGLKYKTVMARINDYKWTIEKALELE